VDAVSSTGATAGSRDAQVRFFGLVLVGLAALTAMRLAFAAVIPLTEDEAYYRLWAMHPQLGYYDHPPMVAWWLAVGLRLGGDTPLGARLIPVLASAVAGVLIFDIAQLAGLSSRTAARAAAWYNAAPLVGFGAMLILPDSATTLFWCLTLWALLKSQRTGRGGWWILAGAAAGCAALSKYSALFLGPGVLWWLLRSATGRRQLRGPWPWVALSIAGALFMTNVAWNAGHLWITFAKQFGRVAPHGFKPLGPASFLIVLVLLSNPLTTPFLVRTLGRRLRLGGGGPGPAGAEPRQACGLDLIVISAVPFFAYLCLHSLHADVEAHWPAPLYPTLAILAAAGADGPLGRGMRRLAATAPVVGFALSSVALIHMAAPKTDGVWRRDPSHPLRGWTPFLATVEGLRVANGAAWIGTVSYGTYAQLEDHRGAVQSTAPMLQVTERRRYLFQPPLSPSILSKPGLIVDLSRRMSTSALSDCFSVVTPVATLPRGDAVRGDIYDVVKVSGPKRDVAGAGCRSFHNGKPDD
jgi:4-amino-4-deoxy-L-arabinose transferase-like glycosyltransferase